ncbi:hypothetical protein CVU37_07755 [candidate division BRC1 bacterium HGW-BRC1-1]|nr:MAG: hypothetical protein CVU37_07755 [candidate division BRC1 bacterium HGW-BRC1-1]
MLHTAVSKTFLSIVSLVFLSGLAGAAPTAPLPEPLAQSVWPGSPRDHYGLEFVGQQFLWDDIKTSLTQPMLNGEVKVITPDEQKVFIGGAFTTVVDVQANRIASWDGENWTALGSGVNEAVNTIALMDGEVYAGGNFTEAGGQAANYIAKWDGSMWSPLGEGLSGEVSKLVALKGSLFAVGRFYEDSPVYRFGIAKWDGVHWSYFGEEVIVQEGELVTDGDNLFVSGSITLNNVGLVKWDGSSWTELDLPPGHYYCPTNLTEDRGTIFGQLALVPGDLRSKIVSWRDGDWDTNGVINYYFDWGVSFQGMDEGGLLLVTRENHLAIPPVETSYGPGSYAYGLYVDNPPSIPAMHVPSGQGYVQQIGTSKSTLFLSGVNFQSGIREYFFGAFQPRVNLSRAAASSGQPIDLGPDAFGFFKPELHCDAAIVDSGSSGIVEINRGANVEVAGARVNGAFRVSHPGVELPGAMLKVEFSSDDVAKFPGASPQDFRPWHVRYPFDYPTNLESLAGDMLTGTPAQFERVENGRNIYSIQFEHTGITGATYAALPLGALVEDVPEAESRLRNQFDSVVLDQDPSLGWRTFPPADRRLGGAEYDYATGSLRAYIYPARNRERIAGVLSNKDQWLSSYWIESGTIVRGLFHVWSGGQLDPENHQLVPNFNLRLQNRFTQSTTLEVFTHLNADPEGTRFGRDIRPSRDPYNPSVYRVDFFPVKVGFIPLFPPFSGSGGVEMMMQAVSTDPQDHGFIALTETVLATYPIEMVGLDQEPQVAMRVEEGTLGADSIASQSRFIYTPSRIPGGFGKKSPARSMISISSGPKGITLDTRSVPDNLIGLASLDLVAGEPSARVRVEEGKLVHIRFHLTSEQQSLYQAQIRLRARSAKFQWNQKYEIGGAWAGGWDDQAVAHRILPGLGGYNEYSRPGCPHGGWYSLILSSPLEASIRPEFPAGTPIAERMPALSAQPGPGSNASSWRDVILGMDLVDTISDGEFKNREKGLVTLDAVEIRTFNRPTDETDFMGVPQ